MISKVQVLRNRLKAIRVEQWIIAAEICRCRTGILGVSWIRVSDYGALIMLLVYRHGKLSVLHSMISSDYVLSIILAALVLKEEIFKFEYYEKSERFYYDYYNTFVAKKTL